MSVPGKLERVLFVSCGGLTDNSKCVRDDLLGASRLSGEVTQKAAAKQLARQGWFLDAQRGWICPNCTKMKALQVAKAAKRAERLKDAGR